MGVWCSAKQVLTDIFQGEQSASCKAMIIKLILDNGTERSVDGASHLIFALPGKKLDIGDNTTWESERARFAQVGRTIWVGGDETATIVRLQSGDSSPSLSFPTCVEYLAMSA